MTNMAVEVALQRAGVNFVRAAVGDRYVLEQLREHGWQLGAEGSGHILSLDRHSTGDGIVSSLLVLAAMKRSEQDACATARRRDAVPAKADQCPDATGRGLEERATRSAALSVHAEEALEGHGRVLIRASGTEPVLRVMVEAQGVNEAVGHAEAIASVVKQATA